MSNVEFDNDAQEWVAEFCGYPFSARAATRKEVLETEETMANIILRGEVLK